MQPYKKQLKPYFILSVCLAYLGYILGNFIILLPGEDMYEKILFLLNEEIESYLVKNKFAFFIHFSWFAFFFAFIGFLAGLFMYLYNNDSGIYRNGEEYGSARYAKKEEMRHYQDNDPENNMILSRNAQMGLDNERLPRAFQRNKNTMVFGGPGSGKTYNYLKPNIMQMNTSYIITDPKGLLIRETGAMLKEHDYEIKIFDLATLSNSDCFNVFRYIKTELDIDRVLEAITEGTKKSENQGEDFWQKAEALLIRSFIAFLWFDGQDNNYEPNLSMIADMLRFVKRTDKNEPSPVEQWFTEQEKLHPDNYAYKQWTLFNDLYEAETRASVLGIAAARYSVFDHKQVVRMVEGDSMDIESWNEKKTAIFIAIPETTDAYNFLAAIFLATAMEVLREKADQVLSGRKKLSEGKKLLHVRWCLDEFANIGKIPHIEKALATFRSRNMSIVIILQALAQLKAMYRHSWSGMVTLCDTLVYLGGEEEETLKYLSMRSGKQTISLRKQSISKGGKGGGSENRDKTGRDLLMKDEVARIKGDECLVFVSKEHVFRDKKYMVHEHQYADLLANKPWDSNWYQYKRYYDEAEKILDQTAPENLIDHGEIHDSKANMNSES